MKTKIAKEKTFSYLQIRESLRCDTYEIVCTLCYKVLYHTCFFFANEKERLWKKKYIS